MSLKENYKSRMNNIKDKQLKYEKALEYEIFKKGEYGFAKNEIKNAKYIFDIWWHVWYFSKRCKSLNSNVEIHYFEPVKKFYMKAKSILWNDKSVFLNNLWISSESNIWTILVNEKKTMQSSKYSSFLNRNGKETKVKFITLKEYLQKNNIKIDILKMDIEWMEFEVLSSRWDFEREKIDNLIVEIHILNEEMESKWIQIFQKIKIIFPNIEIFEWWYRKEVFLLRANKNSWF